MWIAGVVDTGSRELELAKLYRSKTAFSFKRALKLTSNVRLKRAASSEASQAEKGASTDGETRPAFGPTPAMRVRLSRQRRRKRLNAAFRAPLCERIGLNS